MKKKYNVGEYLIGKKVEIIGDFMLLDNQSRIACNLQNKLIETFYHLLDQFIIAKENNDEILAKQIGNIIYSQTGLRDLVPLIKQGYPYMQQVYVSPLKNIALKLAHSIKKHQQNKNNGLPHFKSWKDNWTSLEYDQKQGWDISNGNQLNISFGKRQERVKGQPVQISSTYRLVDPPFGLKYAKALRIIKENNKYYAIFTCPVILPKKKSIKSTVYIDPNIKNLGVSIDNEGDTIEYENIYDSHLKPINKIIDYLKSKRDKCKKKNIEVKTEFGKSYWLPSKRWTRYDNAIKKYESKKRELVKQHLFSYAHCLCKNYDLIGIGNYVPDNKSQTFKNSNRKMRNNTFHGKFQPILKHVANRSGKHVEIIDEKGTTRTCFDCGYVVKDGIDPSIREWTCPCCNTLHIRDENSGLNGSKILHNNYNIPIVIKIRDRYKGKFNSSKGWIITKVNLDMPRLGPCSEMDKCNVNHLQEVNRMSSDLSGAGTLIIE